MRKASHRDGVRGGRPGASRASKPVSSAARSKSLGGAPNAVGGRDLEQEIVEIERLSLDELRIRWRNVWGLLAPAHLRRSLLARVMAYRVQAQALGGLDRNTTRALDRWGEPTQREQDNGQAASNSPEKSAGGVPSTERRVSEPLILKPGTLLSREWQGRMETVMVVTDGFAWNGGVYASLSAVAQAITGTKWSGHRFFGVRPQDRSLRDRRRRGDPPVQFEGDIEVREARSGSILRRVSKASRVAPRASGVTP